MRAALVIDDDERIRAFISGVLRPICGVIVEADTIRSAQPTLEKTDLDLIVLDLRLPNGLGTEIVESLKRLRNDVPVVIVTAWRTDLHEQERWPVVAVLDKPVTKRELRYAIGKATDLADKVKSIKRDSERLTRLNENDRTK